MSFLTDVFEGNFSNLGHDLTAHFGEDLPYYLAAGAAGVGGLGLAGIGPAAGLFGGAAEGAGASAGLFGAADIAGESTLAGAATSALAPEAGTAIVGAGELAGESTLAGAATSTLASEVAGAAGTQVAGTAAGSALAPASGGGGILDSLIGGATKQLTSNPLGIAAAGAGLGMNLFGKKNEPGPNQQAVSAEAAQLGAQGQVLQDYLKNGTLPPAMQAQLDNATKAAKARIISNHAANGQSTNPTTNSALAQELNAVDTNAVAAMADAQIKMLTTGLNATGLSSQLYTMLTQLDRQDNKDLMNSIAAFAAALNTGAPRKAA